MIEGLFSSKMLYQRAVVRVLEALNGGSVVPVLRMFKQRLLSCY
jgi:hypothetical protein